jgi:hypothetical protein
LNKLRELIAAEIARRDNSEDMKPGFQFVVYDKHPGVVTDVNTAVQAIIEQANTNEGELTYVTRAIQDEVVETLERRFPRRWVLCYPIVTPGESQRERGRLVHDYDPARAAEAADRVAERIERMRTNAK